jgi:hypothetical protein
MVRIGHTTALVVAGIVLAACASGASDTPTQSPSSSEWVAVPLEWARANSAAEEQIDVLVQGLQTGGIGYSDLEPLLSLSYECIEDLGFSVAPQPPDYLTPDLPYPAYNATYGPNIDLSTSLPLLDECENSYTTYALYAYANQPQIIEYRQARFESIRDDAIACLREHGYAIDDDATPDEIRETSFELTDAGLQAGEGAEVVWCVPEDIL